MDILALLLIAVALSMDAFAVAVSSGMICTYRGWRNTIKLAAFFGFFQFLMPVIGYFLGKSLYGFIHNVDHWIAFALLAFIGAKMIIETIKEGAACDDERMNAQNPFATKNLFVMAIATSIDALAVGITFALTDENIWLSSVTIGVITFVISALGVVLGNKVGRIFKKSAGIIGGGILICIGLKILLEHLAGG
jgi:putative Mn2+ efflux pump MntP